MLVYAPKLQCANRNISHPTKSMKRILIDLEKLKDPYVGLGEVSLRYATALAAKAPFLKEEGIILCALVPPSFVGYWGNAFTYFKTGFRSRYFPGTMPAFDVWHSLHQTTGYDPARSARKVLLTIHDLNLLYEKTGWKAEKYRRKIQKKTHRASVISTISAFSAEEIRQHLDLNGKEVHVIRNGVANPLNQPSHAPKQLPPEGFLFHISSLTAKKNTHTLVEMMRILPEKTLVIAGNWQTAYAQQMKKRIEVLDLKNIIRLHQPSAEEKNWLYSHCAAFLFPSLFEGFGLPVIEAFYAGKPVFSSPLTSLREIGGNQAVFWENFDPEYMAMTIRNAPDFNQSDAAVLARKNYASQFNWEKASEEYISLYKAMLAEK